MCLVSFFVCLKEGSPRKQLLGGSLSIRVGVEPVPGTATPGYGSHRMHPHSATTYGQWTRQEAETIMAKQTDHGEQHRRRRYVCLFGISADPPTGTSGHVGIVKQLISYLEQQQQEDHHEQQEQQQVEQNMNGNPDDHTDPIRKVVDEIRILPVYRHTFVEKRSRLIGFDHRMEMCRRAFVHLFPEKVVVSNDEYESWKRAAAIAEAFTATEMDSPSPAPIAVGTAALMEYLQEQEPDTVFYFCLGADSFVSLMEGKWKESDRVLKLLQGRFIVINRIYADDNKNNDSQPGSSSDASPPSPPLEPLVRKVPGAQLLPPNPELGSVSSSQLRAQLQNPEERNKLLSQFGLGKKDLKDDGKTGDGQDGDERLILSSVLEYIEEQGLYQS